MGSVDTGGLPFDNVFTMSDGFVARQTRHNDPSSQLFTWIYYSDCSSEIIVPLSSAPIDPIKSLLALHGYPNCVDFIAHCETAGLQSGHVIDLSHLFGLLIGISKREYHLREMEQVRKPIFFKCQINGVWRRVPFLDSPDFIHFLKTYGVPVVQADRCFAPAGTEPDSCRELYANRSNLMPPMSSMRPSCLPTFAKRSVCHRRSSG
jgi:hypothetical protein